MSFGSLRSYNRFIYLKQNVLAPGDITTFLSYYYNLDSSSISNTLIQNIVTSTYDASLINLTTLDTTNPKLGTACLALTNASSQYMNINNINITTNGSSIAYWVKTNNTTDSSNCFCVFDFNNGIGDRTIKHLIYNNSLNSYVMNNSYKNATISYSNYTDLSLSSISGIVKLAVSDNNTMIISCNYYDGTTNVNGTFYRKLNGTIWSTPVKLATPIYEQISITPDGSTVVGCSNNTKVFYHKWNNSTNKYDSAQQVDTISKQWWGVDISADSKMIVVIDFNSKPYYSKWNGSSYNTFTATLEGRSNQWTAIKLSSDKQRIFYVTNNAGMFYSTWNGTNFPAGTQIGTTLYAYRSVSASLDGNIVFGGITGNGTTNVVYSYYDTSTGEYSDLFKIPSTYVSTNKDSLGLWVTSDNTIYYGDKLMLIKIKMNISTQSLCTNLFNIPQNTYNHIVQTTSNTGISKFYLNNTLMNTFTSQIIYSNILTTTNNIGFSPGLKNSYFDGRIDDFRVYNKELTVNDVNTLYNYS
jgi:hypothetical protein